jgi:hypothetical protein
MRALLFSAIALLPTAVWADDRHDINQILSEFKADSTVARAKYRGKSITLEIEVAKRVTEGNKTYYQASTTDGVKGSRVLFRLAKTYRPTDKLIVAATLKSATWQAEDHTLYFDPADVEKEVRVLPPLFTSNELLKKYDGSPKKTADEMVGKSVEIKGTVRFVKGTGVILEFAPLTDAKGRVVTDKQGFEKLGRALVTVNFSDGSVKKASLAKGVDVEVRGVIDSMQSGVIVIRDAHLLSK